jgi:hypothetical protein
MNTPRHAHCPAHLYVHLQAQVQVQPQHAQHLSAAPGPTLAVTPSSLHTLSGLQQLNIIAIPTLRCIVSGTTP